jgi:thioredoxin 1
MRRTSIVATLFGLTVFGVCLSSAAKPQSEPVHSFAPLEKWRLAVLSGDVAALRQLYSASPEPRITNAEGKPLGLQDEVAFWSGWKAKGLTDAQLEVAQEQTPQPNVRILVLRVAMTLKEGVAPKKEYVTLAQGWVQQGDQWRIGLVQRSDPAHLRQPIENKDLYPATADAQEEIAEALHTAAATHKRVLVVFGGNWCYDCHVLDEAFHSPEIAPTLERLFEVVHVDIGQMDKNLDVAKKYDVPLDRGVPAIAVLDSDGKLLFSQKRGEFEAARSMAAEDILGFLNKWKPSVAR